MKRLLLFAVILLGFSVLVFAQDTPKAEVFGGYSYVRCDAGEDVDCNLHGWNARVEINGNQYLGIVADFSGVYDTHELNDANDVDRRIHSFLFGPKFAMRKGKVTPFIHALFGLSRTQPGDFGRDGENNFGMALGGGIDINITDRIAVRPVQIDYLGIKMRSEITDNLRYSGGIVFKLGKR